MSRRYCSSCFFLHLLLLGHMPNWLLRASPYGRPSTALRKSTSRARRTWKTSSRWSRNKNIEIEMRGVHLKEGAVFDNYTVRWLWAPYDNL
jgi:hypothetical protein